MLLNQINSLWQHKWIRIALFYMVVVGFILLNAYLVLKKDTFMAAALPLILLVAIGAFFSYHKLVWFVVIFTPLSVELRRLWPGLPIDMHLPTEPVMVLILFLFLLAFFAGKRIDRDIAVHPVSVSIYFYLIWTAITTVTSTLPLVSFKVLLTQIWFVLVFFFLLAMLFKKPENRERMIWMYALAFVPVILYAIFRLSGFGLSNQKAAHSVMVPFFNDHTSYGAALAFFIPPLIGFAFNMKTTATKLWAGRILLALFSFALLLSYTRAAWLGLMIGFGVWAIMKLELKFKKIFIAFLVVIATLFAFQDQILMELERNSQDSSGDLMEHLTSMTNISTDASNLERINRWHCAINMFEEKPLFGWGPGTYAMQYAPFQLKRDRTIISTNYGDGGNAHSEYLGALAETGLVGMLSFMLIIILVLYTGINAYTRTKSQSNKTMALSAIVGLTTYYAHGILNNFLDTDKISLPFWGFAAILVMIDIESRKAAASPSPKVDDTYPEGV